LILHNNDVVPTYKVRIKRKILVWEFYSKKPFTMKNLAKTNSNTYLKIVAIQFPIKSLPVEKHKRNN
jgi:hypothetical protein